MHVFLTSSIFDKSGFYSSNYIEEYGAQTRGAKEKKYIKRPKLSKTCNLVQMVIFIQPEMNEIVACHVFCLPLSSSSNMLEALGNALDI